MRLNDQIYDITAWNLPMLFDVELATSPTAISVKSTPVPSSYDATVAGAADPVGQARLSDAVGIGGGRARPSMRWSTGIRVRSVGGSFTLNGRKYPIGTALIRNAENPADLNARLAALAARHGAEVVPIDSSYVDEGTSLGSNDVAPLKAPKVLLVWDAPTSTLSAGWTRYVLERRFGQNVTAVRTGSLGRADFSDFDVVVMPSANFGSQINDGVLNRLKDWLRGGGTLVTHRRGDAVGDRIERRPARHDAAAEGRPARCAAFWRVGLGFGGVEWVELVVEWVGRSGGSGGGGNTPKPAEFDYDKAIQPDRERPASQPGAILRVTLDTNHWLTAGSDGETQVMIEGPARVRARSSWTRAATSASTRPRTS